MFKNIPRPCAALLATATVFAASATRAQVAAPAGESPVRTISAPVNDVRLLYGADARVTRLFGETAVLTGGRVGVIVNRTTTVAFAARASLTNNVKTRYTLPSGRTAGLSFGYGGLELGRVLQPVQAVHLTTSVLLGGGAAGHHDRAWRDGDDPLAVDGFWLAEPEVALQANVTRRMRVGLGGSYRFVHGARLEGIGNRDLRGAAGSLTLSFGRF